jgi:hypothetical protein
MTDTPMTDAVALPRNGDPSDWIHADFARQLERENKRLREALTMLYEFAKPFMRDEWQNKALDKARAALEDK